MYICIYVYMYICIIVYLYVESERYNHIAIPTPITEGLLA